MDVTSAAASPHHARRPRRSTKHGAAATANSGVPGRSRKTAPGARLVQGKSAHGAGKHQRLGAVRGIMIVPVRQGGRAITAAEMSQAVAAVRMLPAADVAMVAAAGVQIQLVPAGGLEGGLLGATTIVQGSDGRWTPTKIRVAAQAGLTGTETLSEIVQHEFGHAISVLRSQDRSEAAAIAYARKH